MSSAFVSTPLGSLPKQDNFQIAGTFNTGFLERAGTSPGMLGTFIMLRKDFLSAIISFFVTIVFIYRIYILNLLYCHKYNQILKPNLVSLILSFTLIVPILDTPVVVFDPLSIVPLYIVLILF